MRIEQNFSLKAHNTFHVPAKTRWFMEYDSEEELEKILRDEYFQECLSLHIGGGSNLLFINDFNGIILHSCINGIELTEESPDSVLLRVGAAEIWDKVVAFAVEKGWGGIENLSHIPGETGAAAVQNIGAYGAEIKDVVETVETYNQLTRERRTFSNEECNYSYRHSYFKEAEHDPYIVTYVNLRLHKNPIFKLGYGNICEALEGKQPSLSTIRETIVAIRRNKLPDPEVLGSAGSFFTNPLISQQEFELLKKGFPSIPSYPAPDGRIKVPAGWLIEQCGWKGKRKGNAGVYEKQALVIVNHGEATGDEIAMLADEICLAVHEKFGIPLQPEVRLIY